MESPTTSSPSNLPRKESAPRTVRWRSGSAVRIGEMSFRSWFGDDPSIKLVVDPPSRNILDANPAACRFYGRDRKSMVGMSFAEIGPGHWRRAINGLNLAALRRGMRLESRHRVASGDIRNVEVLLGPMKIRGRSALLVVVHDTTRQRRWEEKLKEREKYLSTILNSVQAGVVLIDAESHKILDANVSALELIGVQKKDVVDAVCHRFICPAEEGKCPITDLGQHVEKSERILLTARGGRIPVVKSVVPVTIGGRRCLLESFIDVTDQREAERVLFDREESFRLLFAANPHPMFVCDRETLRFLEVNDAAVLKYGYSRAEFLLMRIVDIRPAEDVPRLMEDLRKPRQIIAHTEGWRHRLKSGEIIDVEITSHTLDFGGRRAVLVVAQDVTTRKQAEQQVLSSLHEKVVLLKEIHHRVKNNMQVVSSLLSLQAEAVGDPEAKAGFLETMGRVRSMAAIHEKLYSSDNFADIDFGEHIRSVTAELLSSSQNKRVACSVVAKGIHFQIDVAVPCGLIVHELVLNALKHAFPGGRTGVIEITLCRAGDRGVVLTVRDDGIGFPADMDFRDMPSMGMTLVMGLVQQLGGTIQMDRSHGTKVTITFAA